MAQHSFESKNYGFFLSCYYISAVAASAFTLRILQHLSQTGTIQYVFHYACVNG